MQSTIERRQRIIDMLNMRRSEKIDNLANELGVARRTIQYAVPPCGNEV